MILDDILEILRKKSDDKAYTINQKSYTYKELYKFVCNIYNFLLEKNKEKKTVIVLGHKEVYMKATFLACSFAGITYVPVDENIPLERLEKIEEQINPALIIGKDISKKEIFEIMNKDNFEEINQIYLKPDDIYYIIFTSGSTGIPKGVKVTYKNIDSCINWLKRITNIKKEIILNQANFSFDLTVADLYLSLVSSSEQVVLSNQNINLKEMFENLKLSNCNIAIITPTFADLLLLDKRFERNLLPNLHTILFCGEKLLKSTVDKLYSRFGNIRIINCYGPTEATFAVTSIEINKKMLNYEELPIGIPKEDVEIYILDENKKQLPDGEIGEILIVGESVADGYINNLQNNNFIIYNGKKAYLTGDLGYIDNGILYYKNRKDKQIKFKGYRIELSDIENNLYSLDYIEKNVVVSKKKNNKVLKIIAFVILKENINKTEKEIEMDLLQKIPKYMCPKIKIIKEFPINENGKLNEKELLEEI